MIGKNFVFNGVSIPYSAVNARTQRWIADIDIHRVGTSGETTERQDFHGVISHPTHARGRLISVSGEFFGTKEQRGAARNAIENLFVLESFPDGYTEFKKLEFTDDDGSEWWLRAKVYTPPEYQHERGHFLANFSLELFAESPLIKSKDIVTVTGNYGLYGGVELPMTLPDEFDSSVGIFSETNAGNFASPCKVTVTGDILNPKIINLTTGAFWKHNGQISEGDTLIIDTGIEDEKPSVQLNGASAIANRAAGSSWLFAHSGVNYFVLIGDNYDMDDTDKATAKVEFYSAKK